MEIRTQKHDLSLVAVALGMLWSVLLGFTNRGTDGWIFVTAALGGSLGGLIASNPQRFGPKTIRMFMVGVFSAALVIIIFIYIQEGGPGLPHGSANNWAMPLWFLFQLIGLAFGAPRNSYRRKL
jgi:hypothetical protein